jgi:hypothetical protein
MHLAHLTTDDTNLSHAQQLAEERRATVQGWCPKDGPPNRRFDAIIYDLDHWAFECGERARLLHALSTEPLAVPVAVHSYGLAAKQIRALRRNGVLVVRCLKPKLFERLEQAATTLAVPQPGALAP